MGENPGEQLAIGSTTKIMTALEILAEGTDPDEEITVPPLNMHQDRAHIRKALYQPSPRGRYDYLSQLVADRE